MCRDVFRRIATDRMLSPAEAWDSLASCCEGFNADELARFREGQCGLARRRLSCQYLDSLDALRRR
jgi:hypothetical protein